MIIKEMEFEKMKDVENIRVFDHMGGFDVDTYHFPLTVGNTRIVIFSPPILEGLVKGFRNSFGKSIVQAILWNQGKEAGKITAKMYKEDFGISKARDALEMLKARALMFGWTYMELLTFNEVKRKAVIRLLENWECDIFKGSNEPQNHFMRGILAGFFECLFGRVFNVTEVKCIAKGDPYCEFIVEKMEE
ncbi:MAG: 4-vinyl reductase [Candidatus Brockarchaeota archaeon]|nr:4-vinyl reductase [Candidatus Brockarchaeota archaeon]